MEHAKALARRSSRTSNGPPANNILLRIRSGSCLMDCETKTALPRYAVERIFPKVFKFVLSFRANIAQKRLDLNRAEIMRYLSHNASFHSKEQIAPSNLGTKNLGSGRPTFVTQCIQCKVNEPMFGGICWPFSKDANRRQFPIWQNQCHVSCCDICGDKKFWNDR